MLARALAVVAVALALLSPQALATPLHGRTHGGAVTFEEPGGRTVLRQAGPIEVRVGGQWQAAPQVKPVTWPDAHGVLALSAGAPGVEAVRISFYARPGERYLGFGERSNSVDQRGHEVENYVAEGPFEEDERPAVPAFVPSWGFHPRDDATYFPIPWLLSTAGYGVLLDSDETSLFRLDTEQAGVWSVEVEASELRLRVFTGPEPADVLARFTQRTGRQPAPPAPFVFGPWYQPTGSGEEAVLAQMQGADVPLSVAQTYTHYLPCESQRDRRDAEAARVGRFHAAGLAITTYFNPMICTTHTRFGRPGTLLTNAAGEPYVFRYSTLESFSVGQIDFTASAGRQLYGELLNEAIVDGHDGWMEDFGEYTPLDAHGAADGPGTAFHNRYPTWYHCGAHAAAPRSARFVRSGWTGTARCAPIVWGGDPSVDWGFDGLRSVVTNGLTMGLSGVSTWGSDIGGFFSLFENTLSPELLIRWIEVGAVSGVMRTQANGIRIPPSARPQVWDADIVGIWRRWAKLRTQLYPYLAAADQTYRSTGLPIMRHLVLEYPRDPLAAGSEDTFLFGPDLLAAPVLDQGAVTRSLYLPHGTWVDLWRSASYRESDGGLSLGSARLLRGGQSVELPAPLGELPLLARAGTLLPLLSPDVDTLAAYGDSAPNAVSLNERDGSRVLLAFPRGWSSARLEDGGLLSSREGWRRWKLHIHSKRTREWTIEASLATLHQRLRPCSVKASGGRLSAWSFDPSTRVLRAKFTTRDGSLVVRGCK